MRASAASLLIHDICLHVDYKNHSKWFVRYVKYCSYVVICIVLWNDFMYCCLLPAALIDLVSDRWVFANSRPTWLSGCIVSSNTVFSCFPFWNSFLYDNRICKTHHRKIRCLFLSYFDYAFMIFEVLWLLIPFGSW